VILYCELQRTAEELRAYLFDRLEHIIDVESGKDNDGSMNGEGMVEEEGESVDMSKREYAEDSIASSHRMMRIAYRLNLTRHIMMARLDSLCPASRSGRIAQVRRIPLLVRLHFFRAPSLVPQILDTAVRRVCRLLGWLTHEDDTVLWDCVRRSAELECLEQCGKESG